MSADYLIVCLTALAAGFIQGLSGFGAILVALPLLVLLLDLKTAVPLASLWAMTINLLLLLALRRHLRPARILPLVAASVPGILLGVYTLHRVPVRFLEMALGGLLVIFSLYFLWSRGQTRQLSRGWAYGAGFGSGFLGGSLAVLGPPVIIYTTLQPWSKDEIKSTLIGFFFLAGIIILTAQGGTGLLTGAVLRWGLLSTPFVVLGVMAGTWCYHRLDTTRYRRLLVLLITVLGLFCSLNAAIN